MTTLALDTATPCPGLALVRDGAVVAERLVASQPGAGRRVAQELHILLEEAGVSLTEVDRIVVGVGPGGFTGLRIGIATALGLGQALDVSVVGVSSLETLALGIARHVGVDAPVVPVIDARRGEVFTAVYDVDADGTLAQRVAPAAVPVADLAAQLAGLGAVVVAGDGAGLVAESLGQPARVVSDPEVALVRPSLAVARADAGGGLPVRPMYLRLPDAEVNRRRRLPAAG